ncbi:hypothetical protein DFH11DRAFT_1546351 [Phellopilus nigrolimitatus]|nr:hypothetical protein DFH11DRAFT_1546351 [Phellopilus nigrolimitatus]
MGGTIGERARKKAKLLIEHVTQKMPPILGEGFTEVIVSCLRAGYDDDALGVSLRTKSEAEYKLEPKPQLDLAWDTRGLVQTRSEAGLYEAFSSLGTPSMGIPKLGKSQHGHSQDWEIPAWVFPSLGSPNTGNSQHGISQDWELPAWVFPSLGTPKFGRSQLGHSQAWEIPKIGHPSQSKDIKDKL